MQIKKKWNKQRQSMKKKAFAQINEKKKKEALFKQIALVIAANSIK